VEEKTVHSRSLLDLFFIRDDRCDDLPAICYQILEKNAKKKHYCIEFIVAYEFFRVAEIIREILACLKIAPLAVLI